MCQNDSWDLYDAFGKYVLPAGFEADLVLFHGGADVVEEPVFGFGAAENDAGVGFYTSPNFQQAAEWASAAHGSAGTVSFYNVPYGNLGDMLDMTQMSPLYWVTMLINYRWFGGYDTEREFLTQHFFVDVEQYDVIKAYRCDDNYFDMVKSFLSDDISLDNLLPVLEAGELGLQYVMKSQSAHSMLQFIDSKVVGNDYASSYHAKVSRANAKIDELKFESRRAVRQGEDYVLSDMIYEFDSGDPTLVELYQF